MIFLKAMQQQQVNNQGGMMGQQRAPFADDMELARQQNLMKIQQLRQTLEAAQQQEAQYKSQLEVNVSHNVRHNLKKKNSNYEFVYGCNFYY